MANTKLRRGRSSSAESGSEEEQQTPAKRSRTSGASKNRPVSPGSPSAPSDDIRTPAEGNGNVESEGESDDGDDDSENDAEKEELKERQDELYQMRVKRKQDHGKNAIRAGTIESVNLIDFMCHRNLTIVFGSELNFLVGHNGSGKSAVLTAIAVAMGGKAASTGRGSGLKDLIRRGSERAAITLTLKNGGVDAYKPDVYPERIIIERNISKTGSSAFKFRAKPDGKILANTREELTAITAAFGIDVDQPLCILTQDQARSFLQTADEKQLYKFFMKSTRLQEMRDYYARADSNVKNIQNQAQALKSSIPEMRQKIVDLQRKLQATEKIQEMIKKVDRLRSEQAWAYVNLAEKNLREKTEDFENLEEKMKQCQENIDKATTEAGPLDAEIAQQEEKKRTFESDQQPAEQAARAARIRRDTAKNQLKDLEDLMKGMEHTIRDCNKEINDYDKKIKERRAALDSGKDPAIVEAERQLELVRDRLNKIEKEIPRLASIISNLEQEKTRMEEKKEEVDQKFQDAVNEVRSAEDQVQTLKGQTTDRMAAFGYRIKDVLQEIDKARWHLAKPVGPMGQYIQLDDMKYSNVMEAFLGNAMCGFAVQDTRDRQTLLEILRRCGRGGYRPAPLNHSMPFQLPQVLLNSNDMFDYSSGDQSGYGPTMLSKLTFTNEYVKRAFITLLNIESTFVSPDVMTADRETDRLLNVGLRRVVIISADGHRQDSTMNSRQNTPISNWRGTRLFTRDFAEAIREAEAEVQSKKAIKAECERERKEYLEQYKKTEQDLAEKRRNHDKMKADKPKYHNQIEKLRDQVNQEAPDDIAAFQAQKDDTVLKKNTEESQLEQTRQDKQRRQAEFDELKKECKALEDRVIGFAEEKDRIAENLRAMISNRQKNKGTIEHWNDKMRIYETRVQAAREVVADKQNTLDQWTEQAARLCPERIQTRRSGEEIKKEETVLKASIEAAQKRQNIDVDKVKDELLAARVAEKETLKKSEELMGMQKTLSAALIKRKKFWQRERKSLEFIASVVFAHNIGQRGFQGELKFDDHKNTLALNVSTTTGTVETGKSKVPKHLSGGERSFSTVSLLMALWDVSADCFRCLDEWDVFLDSVNRRLAANMLIAGARGDQKQYILITPQNMSGVTIEEGSSMKIIRMQDPVRNQGTLPFEPVRA